MIPNTVYRLRAHDYTTGKEVRAITTLKPRVNFDDVKSLPLIVDDTTTFYSYEYKFTDIPGEENYYLVTATGLNLAKGGLSELEKSLLSVLGNDFPLYADKVTGDGKPVSYYPQFPDTHEGDTLAVTLSHITKECFNYLTAYKKKWQHFQLTTFRTCKVILNQCKQKICILQSGIAGYAQHCSRIFYILYY